MATREQNVKARGEILRLARRFGGNGVSIAGVDRIFQQAGMFAALSSLEENIEYLQGKGYLAAELATDPLSDVERWIIRITPAGIDLLDGVIPADPGVDRVC